MHGFSRRGGLALAVGLLVGPAAAVLLAQAGISTYEQVTVGSTAVGIASATTNPTGRQQMQRCVVQADHTLRWRADGTAPTAAVGMTLTDSDALLVLPTNAIARAFRMISTSGVDSAIVNVTCDP